MARGAILAACFGLLLASACSAGGFPNSFKKLSDAIKSANSNAVSCGNRTGCFGTPVVVDLTSFATLTKPLPYLKRNAVLTVNGKCGKKNTNKCIIDGAGRFSIFTSSKAKDGTAISRLTLNNLIIQKAKGGVFVNLWIEINASGVTFKDNLGGVELAGNVAGGFPARRFSKCDFINNNGSAISAGNIRMGLSSSSIAYQIINSSFVGNWGDPTVQDGGAVALYGKGQSIFQNVLFDSNTAYGSGGAIYAAETSLRFRSVTFKHNIALSGTGGAISAANGAFNSFVATFCSSTFSGNYAIKNPKSASLAIAANSFRDNSINVQFCDTPFVPGSLYPTPPIANVVFYKDRTCLKSKC